ncbi:MAG: hypothetical protein Q8873_02140 [Bacillota bacterium]|nr:hypothetical protein [Bacillota bacterium]
MFGKNLKNEPEEIMTTEAKTQSDESRVNRILEEIMKFTGAENLDELEEVVSGASSVAKKDGAEGDDKLYNAIQNIRKNHSILEAKEMEKNEDFVNAILAGFDPEKAYRLAMSEKLISDAYAEGEERGKSIAASHNDRINEVGMTVSGGYKAEIDPQSMTMDELKKIKERLNKGEKVRL